MKKISLIIGFILLVMMLMPTFWMTSCKKSSNSSSSDSATFLLHLHTQIADSTIGGNKDGTDSNTTGSGSIYPWYFDDLHRHICLLVPQFFISNIMLVNQSGTMVPLKNVVVLKGLDSEDYYLCKVPTGTYVSVMFNIGLNNSDSTLSPTINFIHDSVLYPTAATMWNSSALDYYGMYITGLYDTSAVGIGGGTPINPISFKFAIPNGLTIQHQIMLPTRTFPANQAFGIYLATAGSINYIHIICDYGKLLSAVNLRTSNQTSANPLIADTLANKLPEMFSYEQ